MLTFIGVPRGTSWPTFLGVVGRAAVAAVVLIGIGFALSLPTPLAAGRQLLDTVGEAQTDALTWLVRRVSGLGNVWVVGAACVAALVWLQARRPAIAGEIRLLVIGAFGGALVITAPLKLITARPRPSGALVGSLSSAFPSGHALRTAAVLGLLVWLAARYVAPGRRRLATITATALLICAIASARVYLWAHWPSDVGVGLLLGTLWLLVLLKVTEPLRPITGRSGSVAPPGTPG